MEFQRNFKRIPEVPFVQVIFQSFSMTPVEFHWNSAGIVERFFSGMLLGSRTVFLRLDCSRKKSKQGGFIGLGYTFLEFFDLSLYPWKFRSKQAFTTGNSKKIVWHPLEIIRSKTETHGNSTWVFLEHPSKFRFLINWPLEFPHALTSTPLEIPCPQLPCLYFVWNSPFKDSPEHLSFL